jgi:hypothetical protein
VIFDVGHGVGSFAFAVARAALAQDLRPGTISSDLHAYNVQGPVFDLATTMTKFLALGLGLDEVVRMSTAGPAKVIGATGRLGTLAPGAAADVTMLRLAPGSFELTDTRGETMTYDQRLMPVRVVRNGAVRAASLQTSPRPATAAPSVPPGTVSGRAGLPGGEAGQAALNRLGADPGLCAHCLHARLVASRRSVFLRCGVADADPRFARYPRLPVNACDGFSPVAS